LVLNVISVSVIAHYGLRASSGSLAIVVLEVRYRDDDGA
jgi:hypothetical protein